MGTQTPEMRVVLERLERLETQNRRFRQAGALALAAFGVMVLTGQVEPKKRTIEAEKFVVTDEAGRSRAELWADRTTTQLALYDLEGRRGVSLVTDTQGNASSLSLFNKYGMRLLVSAYLDSGGVSLAEKKEASDWQYRFELAEHGAPNYNSALSLWNARSKAHASLVTDASGPSLGLITSEGFATVLGSTSLETPDAGAHRTSAASLVMLGKDGNVIWQAP